MNTSSTTHMPSPYLPKEFDVNKPNGRLLFNNFLKNIYI